MTEMMAGEGERQLGCQEKEFKNKKVKKRELMVEKKDVEKKRKALGENEEKKKKRTIKIRVLRIGKERS